ncbi:MAG: NAD(P)/FAD-dependent oxidoreductase [Jatrophihabitantaceae bacterium]
MTAVEPYDVIVVGAGPAGCAAAAAVRQADPELSVLVVDRADFPRDKACGDGIAYEATDALAELGFDLPVLVEGTQGLCRLTVRSPGGIEVRRDMRRQVRVIPRTLFDARLVADLRRRGIEIRRHSVRTVQRCQTGVLVDGTLRARVLIGADGAESVVRRAIGVPATRPGRIALAIRGYAPSLAGAERTQLISMAAGRWPAYAWSFPIGDGRANVGYGEVIEDQPLSRADLLANLARLLPGLSDPTGLRAHRLPLSSGRPPISPGPILLVGDAQSMINPFTGEGIFYAVVSGMLAGRAAVAAVRTGTDAGLGYRHAMRRRLGRHLRHTSALARLSGWPGLIEAGIRAARADQRCFDDLVDFGLSDGLLTPRLLSRLRFG